MRLAMCSRTRVSSSAMLSYWPSFLGKVVVQLRQGALLDRLHLDVVGHGLAGQLGLGVVGRVDDLGLQLLAGLGAAQSAS